MIDPLPVSRPCLFGKELEYVEQALRSTHISGTGSFVDRMEALVAEAAGTCYAVVVSSGTSALDLAFEALGVAAGDEVIAPNFTMFAPVAALLRRGATVVPVDADDTWNMDPDGVEAALTDRTKGIVLVHTYGHPADATRICELARRRGIWVVEDAAEALGAQLDGRPAGAFGDLATFSFYANKVVTSGEGGAVVTNDPVKAARLRALRSLCFGDSWAERFVHTGAGFNFRLSNVLAAIGCAQLEHLSEALASKRAVAARYRQLLGGVSGLGLPPESARVLHSYWVFGVLLPSGRDRRSVADQLWASGIETRPFFHPLHRQPSVPPVRGAFPRSEQLSNRGLYLPSYVGMAERELNRVVHAIHRALAT
ncbi:DegT/DnrJ/EryC1/StrS aminotransferase family protein [Corallococcus caeni]|uniref:DegT/DnrJ/EryC1/StrS family aminotransferase n=1 Tax=Corallococcus caeni TaxID=3082388 RepID=UPI0029569FF9|nr:DegT/DnrJ/EryC1/StrS aminotransferase family protein [Corallococcus sp. KH5-1]